MKKIAPIVLLGLFLAGPTFAFDKVQAMRTLTINALLQYGETLYDRGEYDQATAVFDHVLKYDSHQPQALSYLKQMNQLPLQEPSLNIVNSPQHDEQIVRSVDLQDTNSLQAAIEAQKRVIERLHAQIATMKENMATPLEP